jgi:hypothetical protein
MTDGVYRWLVARQPRYVVPPPTRAELAGVLGWLAVAGGLALWQTIVRVW